MLKIYIYLLFLVILLLILLRYTWEPFCQCDCKYLTDTVQSECSSYKNTLKICQDNMILGSNSCNSDKNILTTKDDHDQYREKQVFIQSKQRQQLLKNSVDECNAYSDIIQQENIVLQEMNDYLTSVYNDLITKKMTMVSCNSPPPPAPAPVM